MFKDNATKMPVKIPTIIKLSKVRQKNLSDTLKIFAPLLLHRPFRAALLPLNSVLDFPYFESAGDSAVGSYLNYLETETHIFLPVFGNVQDEKAIKCAKEIFNKEIITVNINSIAKEGGVLNCISWEMY